MKKGKEKKKKEKRKRMNGIENQCNAWLHPPKG
jgi:hypothetical protein